MDKVRILLAHFLESTESNDKKKGKNRNVNELSSLLESQNLKLELSLSKNGLDLIWPKSS